MPMLAADLLGLRKIKLLDARLECLLKHCDTVGKPRNVFGPFVAIVKIGRPIKQDYFVLVVGIVILDKDVRCANAAPRDRGAAGRPLARRSACRGARNNADRFRTPP